MRNPLIKAIIFDFFDVIRTDGYKSWLRTNNLRHEGPYYEASYRQDLGEITLDQFLGLLSELRGRRITLKEMDATTSVNRAVIKLITRLRKNYRVALLSNAPSAFLRGILAEHQLDQYFDQIVISSEVGMVKPNPDIFSHTLERLGVTSQEAIFIDDSEKNTHGAEAVGIKTVLFRSAAQLASGLTDLGVILD